MFRTPSIVQSVGGTRSRWEYGQVAAQDDALLKECVELFDGNYGRWGESGPKPGEPIRMSVSRLKRLLDNDHARIAITYAGTDVVGYCTALTLPTRAGTIHWVTQLVVAESHRNVRTATAMLYSIWQFSDCYAWGLATANPFAVRALETATRRSCVRAQIAKRGDDVAASLAQFVEYIPDALDRDGAGQPIPTVNTEFYIDHSDIPAMRAKAARKSRPWALGDEPADGHEWFACTFRDQPVVDVTDTRLEHLLETSDETWIDAYRRMSLDEDHLWRRHSQAEIDHVLAAAGAVRSVLDAGCGTGRHSEILAKSVDEVLGVDIVPELIDAAQRHNALPNVTYETLDLREFRTSKKFDLALALYDVIGSSARADEDLAVLRALYNSLNDDGQLVLSVMNAEPMRRVGGGLQVAQDEVALATMLENLSPSGTMENSGDVFNPALCVALGDVFYRKEQFKRPGELLPRELVVRDRRFTVESIAELVTRAGFDVVSVAPVRAGRWEDVLPSHDTRAKELLVHAKKTGGPS